MLRFASFLGHCLKAAGSAFSKSYPSLDAKAKGSKMEGVVSFIRLIKFVFVLATGIFGRTKFTIMT